MRTVFLRALHVRDKAAALLATGEAAETAHSAQRFEIDPQSFANIPGTPFPYWAPPSLLKANNSLPSFEPTAGAVRVGVQTDNDPRFVRLWWETPLSINHNADGSPIEWRVFLKGEESSPYYFDHKLLLNWRDDGKELRAATEDAPGGRVNNEADYFSPGLSWALRTARFNPHVVPAGCIFSVSRYLAVISHYDVMCILALWNSSVMDALCKLRMERHRHPKFIVGVVKTSPLPPIDVRSSTRLASLASHAWSLKRDIDTHVENSHAFTLPSLLQVKGDTLAIRASAWRSHVEVINGSLMRNQDEIDRIAFKLFEINELDQRAILKIFGSLSETSNVGTEEYGEVEDTDEEPNDENIDERSHDTVALAVELVSWAVGVAFGRFDIRLALGSRDLPAAPAPFDPLPECSPAMLVNGNEPPESKFLAGYLSRLALDGILVDDVEHAMDLIGSVRRVLGAVFGTDIDTLEKDICDVLSAKSLRDYFRRLQRPAGFFIYHLKRYSMSRRQAPIYWPLSTASGSYTLWIYYHRLTDDTLYKAVNEYVSPKIAETERLIARHEGELSGALSGGAAKSRAALDEARKLLGELEDFRAELLRVAALPYKPNLNDGVLLTAAPLWRLFRLPKWRKDLEAAWKKLEAGEYDWAHLAYSIWPARVEEVCRRDRSIAIAHGLEHLYAGPPPKASTRKRGKAAQAAIAEDDEDG